LDDLKPPHYYASQTAAPTFAKIAQRTAEYLALKPDIISTELRVADRRAGPASRHAPSYRN